MTGTGSYTSTLSVSFSIDRRSITSAAVTLSASSYTYNGKAKTPGTTVKLGSTTLKEKTDYTVTYKSNKNVDTATVKITGRGNYKGTVSKTFLIRPVPSTAATDVNLKSSADHWLMIFLCGSLRS